MHKFVIQELRVFFNALLSSSELYKYSECIKKNWNSRICTVLVIYGSCILHAFLIFIPKFKL